MSAQRGGVGGGVGGGVIGWLVMSFLAVSLAVVVGGIFFAHTIKVHESGGGHDVQVETPFGSVHVKQSTDGQPQTAGLPVYPGARPVKNRDNAVVDLSSAPGDSELHIVVGKWETSDPIDNVRKFYEERFPEMSVVQHDRHVEMHSVDGKSKRVISLHERHGGTEISLASVGEPKAN